MLEYFTSKRNYWESWQKGFMLRQLNRQHSRTIFDPAFCSIVRDLTALLKGRQLHDTILTTVMLPVPTLVLFCESGLALTLPYR